jgi:hypothetical protein
MADLRPLAVIATAAHEADGGVNILHATQGPAGILHRVSLPLGAGVNQKSAVGLARHFRDYGTAQSPTRSEVSGWVRAQGTWRHHRNAKQF